MPESKLNSFDAAQELTRRIQSGDKTASRQVLDLQQKMSPVEYRELLQSMQVRNINDRQLNDKLPKLLITVPRDGPARFAGTDKAPQRQNEIAPKSERPVEKAQSQRVEREYRNTNGDRERAWNDFFPKK